jgi:CRISPR-associated endonuclease Csn1
LQRPAKLEFPLKTEDVNAKLNTLFVSRQPSRKVTGAAHEETIRSDRRDRGLGVVETKRLMPQGTYKGLTLELLTKMVDKEGRNNKLYTVLKARLEMHNDKPKIAFAEPAFHEYLKETWTAKAPRITSLKLISSEASGIAINGGLASNGGMVRVDVFTKEHPKKKGKLEYYLCPVYVADYVKATLPNKVMVPGKKESEWLNINGDFQFLFHLYKNDVVKLTTAKGDIIEGYYDGAHRSNAQINLKHHDGDPEKYKESIGVKTLATFEKYSVDYFGNRTLIKKETRHELAHRRRKPKGAHLAKAEPASS